MIIRTQKRIQHMHGTYTTTIYNEYDSQIPWSCYVFRGESRNRKTTATGQPITGSDEPGAGNGVPLGRDLFFFFGSLMLHMYVHEFLFRFPTRRREEKCISREEKGKRFVDCLAVRPYDVCLVSRRARISGAECLRSRETETGRSAPEGEKEAQKTLLGGPNT